MYMPLVSVIIPTHNRAHLLKDAIESALAVRDSSFDIEIIVVDDCSTDATADIAQRYPITYICTPRPSGAATARNVGMDAATGDFIAFLDDDDVWLPGNLVPQLAAFETHPEYGVVHGQVLLADSNRNPFGEPQPQGPLTSGWIYEELLEYWPQLGSVVVRTSVAREIGGFDPSLRSEEEWDWILRIAQRYPIGRVAFPAVLFCQRGWEDDELAWRRLPDTIKVFRRQEHQVAWRRRIHLRPILWAHLGWYTSQFLHSAAYHARHQSYGRALRCVGYALRTSPIHAVVILARSMRPRSSGAPA